MLTMNVAMVQFAPVFGEVEDNLRAIEQACADLSADLVVLPELCTTGYQFRDRRELMGLAEPADGPSLEKLCGVAAACGGHLVAGFAEKEADRFYNSAALLGPDGVAGVCRTGWRGFIARCTCSPTKSTCSSRGTRAFRCSGPAECRWA
jgi:predicted amidohydrolase